jgi:hypothetical protein
MESKYKNGKIYKITDIAYTKCYYGSTIDKLTNRMHKHRTHYKMFNNNKTNGLTAFSIFDEFGIENCKIELVELFPCNSKIELEQREGFYIKNNDCVNKMVAGRTRKEYKEDNKEYYKEYFKQHYIDNKEHKLKIAKNYRNKPEIKEKNKEYHKQYRQKNKEKLKAYYLTYINKQKQLKNK